MLTSSNISFVKRIDPITDCSASILLGNSSALLFKIFKDCDTINIICFQEKSQSKTLSGEKNV